MDKKIVLVTGASSGIGEAVARKLAKNRHTVVLSGRNKVRLVGLERELAGKGQRVVAVSGDLAKEEDARKVVTEALKTFGSVDAVVHSAGVFHVSRLEETPTDTFRSVLDTNLTSLYYVMKYLLPHFYAQKRGQVIAVSSVAGRQGFAGETAYCASKWGLQGFLEALRLEAKERGVRVTSILPGPTLTPAWKAFDGPVPEDKLMAPETVADTILFALDQPENALVESLVVTPSRDPFGGREKI